MLVTVNCGAFARSAALIAPDFIELDVLAAPVDVAPSVALG
jgi:hypothetical protein